MDAIGFKFKLLIIRALFVIVSSVLMATRKNPIHSALWMIVTFFAMVVIYILLNAQFIAVAQVMVYAGAIMMLILFVIMLVSMEKGDEAETGKSPRPSRKKIAWALITLILFVELVFGLLFYRMTGKVGDYPSDMVSDIGNAKPSVPCCTASISFPLRL